jgi:hypothetical protein
VSPHDVDIAVPAYFYPVGHERDWQILASGRHPLRYVIINPHDGVGATTDPAYVEECRRLRRAHVRLLGYIDTDYGKRPLAEVLAEATAYHDLYGITGVFLDQAASGLDMLTHFESYAVALRTGGTRFIVLNPGTYPHAGYFRMANQVVTFEGTWAQYHELDVPDWSLRIPASRIAHFVWAVPATWAAQPAEVVRGLHVGTVCLSTGRLPNPWGSLPPALRSDQ